MESVKKLVKKEEVNKVKAEQIFSYDFPEADGGVIVYKFQVDDLPLSTFFVAALDDTSTELVWGVGDTPQAALRMAARDWDRIYRGTPMREKNPFRAVKHLI